MTKLQKLLVSTALSAFVAFPALAQVTSDTTDIKPVVGISAVADGTSNLGTGAGETVTSVSEAFIGNTVMSSDEQMLGTVTSAAANEDGTIAILVDLDQEVGAEADNAQILLAPGQVSDGTVVVPWTKAEVLSALVDPAENRNDEDGADADDSADSDSDSDSTTN
ncbi:MAG: hypothetical protein Q7J44_08420 [Pseudotabrizicola sp.]|uniref:hypothetical protein n=1 Tax=Pseudotabrizicola sp. TaxID=2939647 RepID=UPI00272599CD|nr:hypothetical protein [Pseudotabrizicola sp.]MDO9638553.1 hypothetical protein [Pseudotabrizicola sp.]